MEIKPEKITNPNNTHEYIVLKRELVREINFIVNIPEEFVDKTDFKLMKGIQNRINYENKESNSIIFKIHNQ